jgi:hypothetical protein
MNPMTTPIVTELPLRLESTERDTFISDPRPPAVSWAPPRRRPLDA